MRVRCRVNKVFTFDVLVAVTTVRGEVHRGMSDLTHRTKSSTSVASSVIVRPASFFLSAAGENLQLHPLQ